MSRTRLGPDEPGVRCLIDAARGLRRGPAVGPKRSNRRSRLRRGVGRPPRAMARNAVHYGAGCFALTRFAARRCSTSAEWIFGMVQTRVAKEATVIQGRGARAPCRMNALSLCPAISPTFGNSFGGVCGMVNATNSTCGLVLAVFDPCRIFGSPGGFSFFLCGQSRAFLLPRRA